MNGLAEVDGVLGPDIHRGGPPMVSVGLLT